ncbi:DUF2000 family protein [Pseudoxanthomonas sp. JBR18]|uniref:DUF2000 family protein n=1 Tax=Pseudoxanthomonas sp. JBR18 TaxID=2969308 RepID=UPI002305C007|nr:DUF2000 family protein [Pseudoxanthomonas sp. JBR18]WCE04839.1 DUF2000 family protein [Pseudoxanthomonas sp. JBR18]
MFDTKVALIVRHDLAIWQRLNAVAFLSTGIAAAAPEALGEPYVDAAQRIYGRMLIQPMMVFQADLAQLQAVHAGALKRELVRLAFVQAMFSTGHDAANRVAFAAEDPEHMNLVGYAIRGGKKAVDKTIKGLALHP